MPGSALSVSGCRHKSGGCPLDSRRGTPALPFCHATLRAAKPRTYKHPKTLKTWRDHIRTRRLDLGLLQKDMAREVGVDKTTVYNWESGRATPAVRYIPGIICFLGYAPYDPEAPFAEKLRARREALGLSQEAFAGRLGVHESTVVRWESGTGRASRRSLRIIKALLSGWW